MILLFVVLFVISSYCIYKFFSVTKNRREWVRQELNIRYVISIIFIFISGMVLGILLD